MDSKEIIFVTGMHRSTTSLFSNTLIQSGANFPGPLLGAGKDNMDGYFENINLLEINQREIEKRSKTILTARKNIYYSDAQFKDFIYNSINMSTAPVFFKDPRQALFLNDVKATLPKSKFIFLFRNYEEVVASLLNRLTDRELIIRPWLAVRAWLEYNEAIYDFCFQHPADCLLIESSDLLSQPYVIIDTVSGFTNCQLTKPNFLNIFKPQRLGGRSKLSKLSKLCILPYRDACENLYQRMQGCKLKI